MVDEEVEELKEELFKGIPDKELSPKSKKKLHLILKVHCNAGKEEIKKAIEKALKPISASLDVIKDQQDTVSLKITKMEEKAFGNGNGGPKNESAE